MPSGNALRDIAQEIKRHSFNWKPGEKQRTKEALARNRNRKMPAP